MDDIFREQLLTFCDADATTLTVVGQLVFVDAADREVAGIRMTDKESADGCRWLYGVVVGQRNAQLLLGVEQVEDDALQRVVGASGIAESNS